MFSCLVCLIENCEPIFNVFNEDNNAIFLISKYLWFKPKQNGYPMCETICFNCWNNLEQFHNFYHKIEEAHKVLVNSDPLPNEQFDNSIGKECSYQKLKDRINVEIDSDILNIIPEKTMNNINDTEDSCNELKKKRSIGSKEEHSEKTLKIESELKLILKKPTSYNSEEIDLTISNFMVLVCEICSKSLPKFSNLKSHFRQHHNKNGYAVCCNRRYFKRCILLEHINSHINPEYFKCSVCKKIMSSKESLRKHINKTHNPNNKQRVQIECNHCHKMFADKIGLTRHQAIHIPQDQWTWKCEDCGKLYASKFLLQTHRNDSHRNHRMCQICGQVVQNKRFSEHMTKHEGIEEARVQCKICNNWMKNKKYLQVHMAKHNDTNRTHMCTICGKLSPNSKALNIHMKYTHSDKKNHQCSICHKSFKRPLVLKQHIAGHTGNPLYNCAYCSRTFIYDSHYHNHRKKVHREQWEIDKATNVKSRTNFLKIKNDEVTAINIENISKEVIENDKI